MCEVKEAMQIKKDIEKDFVNRTYVTNKTTEVSIGRTAMAETKRIQQLVEMNSKNQQH